MQGLSNATCICWSNRFHREARRQGDWLRAIAQLCDEEQRLSSLRVRGPQGLAFRFMTRRGTDLVAIRAIKPE
jgi:hypothetical protein